MTTYSNNIFIATSIDGFIADSDGAVSWLDSIPEINTVDTGYHTFMDRMDALLMGRTTFETVCSFDIEWPYKKPVFVLSNTLKDVAPKLKGKVFIIKGDLEDVLNHIHKSGYHHLYIDGGKVIQSFLQSDLIDEMIITTIPILLGGGIPLFSELDQALQFTCIDTKHFLGAVSQNHFKRTRND